MGSYTTHDVHPLLPGKMKSHCEKGLRKRQIQTGIAPQHQTSRPAFYFKSSPKRGMARSPPAGTPDVSTQRELDCKDVGTRPDQRLQSRFRRVVWPGLGQVDAAWEIRLVARSCFERPMPRVQVGGT